MAHGRALGLKLIIYEKKKCVFLILTSMMCLMISGRLTVHRQSMKHIRRYCWQFQRNDLINRH